MSKRSEDGALGCHMYRDLVRAVFGITGSTPSQTLTLYCQMGPHDSAPERYRHKKVSLRSQST